MNNVVSVLRCKWQSGILHRVYNLKDEYGRGRFCMMFSGLLSSIVSQLTGGFFLTSFLLLYGLDKSRIGILTFVPYMTSMLNLLSPSLLERFAKRRGILITMKLASNAINILGITILPTVIKEREAMVVGFVILVLAANIINQLAGSGWSAWNVAFLPEDIRVDYFQATVCIQSAFALLVTLGVSVAGDMLAGTEYELVLLTIVRYAAFVVAVIDCAIWLIPKEYEYIRTAKAKITNIFILPWKNKKFLLIVMVLALHNFSANLPTATLNAYLLQDVGVGYSLISGINAVYFIFFFMFSKMWKKFIVKHYWYIAYGFTVFLYGLSYFFYAFVTANTIWLYVAVRLVQHVLGVSSSTVTTSLLYAGLPEEDRTNYLSFYTIVINCSVFISIMLGTLLSMIMGDEAIHIMGFGFTSTQLCLIGCSVGMIAAAVIAMRMSKKFQRVES